MDGASSTLTNIILANVHTFNTSSQSYIDTIIDEQWNIFGFGHCM